MTREVDLKTLAEELAAMGETVLLEGPEADRWSVQGVRPGLVCIPTTTEELAAALARCDRAGAAVIPWGGGTQQGLGLPPRHADVAIATSRLSRVVEYEPADLTATVEAGMPFADFQALLGGNDQWLPLDPPLKPGATLGGLIATNASGPRRMKDGGPRDLVIGTRVANVDGAVTRAGGRVVKNVTGYDLNKAHIGALGTLGILVELSFKISPRPEMERSWMAVFPTAEAACRAIGTLSRLPLTPTALDILDRRAASRAGLPAHGSGWVLLGRAAGFRQAVERHLAEFDAAARSAGAIAAEALPESTAGTLWRSYAEMAAESRWSPSFLTCRLAVPPAAIGAICERVAALAGEGNVWAHATGAVFWSVPAAEALGHAADIQGLRGLVEEMGGALVVENRPPELSSLEVWGRAGGPLDIMRAIKARFDPNGTLNPGRFVGGI